MNNLNHQTRKSNSDNQIFDEVVFKLSNYFNQVLKFLCLSTSLEEQQIDRLIIAIERISIENRRLEDLFRSNK